MQDLILCIFFLTFKEDQLKFARLCVIAGASRAKMPRELYGQCKFGRRCAQSSGHGTPSKSLVFRNFVDWQSAVMFLSTAYRLYQF